ncbi:MAG: 50S ribosomal protein L4 [Candidatus Omnitrophota bacterium]|jgi:large subunit ribosomal protein L4|nr:50S ribosomal protein L4 [Candidatus Omnitrophota bacterium]MDD5137613.1 50S ribosomal protein L4 [Candidatus Omnitrophota bacterium]MDD5537593.1 50S ribosomal protein L4 [Candidatus Omnitrophota bacterium]
MEKKNRIVMPVVDMGNKVVEEIELDAHVFDGSVKKKTLYQAIVGYRANRRLGLAETKTRGEVSGGGKKPWRQKGTGRARHGSTRSPLWRHGGVVFGPHPRDFSYTMPQQIRNEALRSSLNARIASGDVVLVEKIHILAPKTKEFAKFLDALKLSATSVLCVLESVTENIKRSARNIQGLQLLDSSSLNAYDVMNTKKIILSRDSLKNLTKRLKHA